MKNNFILGIIALMGLFLYAYPISAQAFTPADFAVVCSSCQNASEASDFGLSQVGFLRYAGIYTTEVIGINSHQTWFVTFNAYYNSYPIDHQLPRITLVSVTAGSSADNQLVAEVVAGIQSPIAIVTSPGSGLSTYPEFATLSAWSTDPNFLWNLAEAQFATQTIASEIEGSNSKNGPGPKLIWDAVQYYLGHGPEATVVFKDGSVGRFRFNPLIAGDIEFIPGTGRTAQGNFYPVNGDSYNNEPYVVGINNNSFNVMTFLDVYGYPLPQVLRCGRVSSPATETRYDCYWVTP